MDEARTNGRELAVRGPAGVDQETWRIQSAPKELGVLLVVAGIGGLLLPGPVGSPFLVAGGVILWPAAFRKVETCLERRFPWVHRQGMLQMRRFINDLERRYPWEG